MKETSSDAPNGASPTVDPNGDPSSSGGNKLSESGKSGENSSTDTSVVPSGQGSGTSAGAGIGRPVLAFNGSKKLRLTATGRQKLEKASYMKISASNYSGGNPAVSAVFYTEASDAQAAEQVAVALGIYPGNVILTPKATGDDQVAVVLHTDTRQDTK